jgi:hypothetical protein
MQPEQIAEAFSRHRFTETYPFLSEGMRWDIAGGQLTAITSYTLELPTVSQPLP